MESNTKAIGYWSNASDYPKWSVNVVKSGRYDVEIDFACDAANAGGSFSIEIDGKPVGHVTKIPSTGDWGAFKTLKLGATQLKPGKHSITIKSKKKSGPLMNLRSVRFLPDN